MIRVASCINSNSFTVATPRLHLSTKSQPSIPQLIKQLRSASGAGMMECKKALTECENDLDGAMDWLRKHGAAKAGKKVAGRENAEGQVSLVISDDKKSAALVKVMSETDFAGRSEDFVNFVTDVTSVVMKQKLPESSTISHQHISGDEVMKMDGIDAKLNDAIVNIRENIQINSADVFAVEDAENNVLSGYLHNRAPSSNVVGQSVAIVEMSAPEGNIAAAAEAGSKLAMHIVAAKPSYQTIESIPADVIEKEKSILSEQMKDSGKPAEVLEKIVNGRMRKFYEENVLIEQAHMVEEGNPKIKTFLEANGGLQIKKFIFSSIK